MASLREEVTAAKSDRTTIWSRLLDSLSEADRVDLLALIDDTSVPISSIHRVLSGRGFRISQATLACVRRGER